MTKRGSTPIEFDYNYTSESYFNFFKYSCCCNLEGTAEIEVMVIILDWRHIIFKHPSKVAVLIHVK